MLAVVTARPTGDEAKDGTVGSPPTSRAVWAARVFWAAVMIGLPVGGALLYGWYDDVRFAAHGGEARHGEAWYRLKRAAAEHGQVRRGGREWTALRVHAVAAGVAVAAALMLVFARSWGAV